MYKTITTFLLFFGLSFSAQSQDITKLETDSIKIIYNEALIGKGNNNEMMVCLTFTAKQDQVLKRLNFSLLGNDVVNDIEKISFYMTDSCCFDSRQTSGYHHIRTIKPRKKTYSANLNCRLNEGKNYIYICFDIDSAAKEGNNVGIHINKLKISDKNHFFESGAEQLREIIDTRTILYHPGDNDSKYYRIPAIITAQDGSVVALCDKRKYTETDLPHDIDIVCNRSVDGGKTWSKPTTIAQGKGMNKGFGDAAIAWSTDKNGLITAFVGGQGLWNSTAENPIRSFISKSYDNGQTWTEPVDITHYIFGSGCTDSIRKQWRASFFGSGNGLRTRNGRIMFVAAIREGEAWQLNNYVVYSDDNGESWQVSQRASESGDEAKVVELNDGRILMSIRHKGLRRYNISNDGGETWMPSTETWNDLKAPACNGDIIVYHGDTLLHSLPYGDNRERVSVFVSTDNGQTWPIQKCIVPYSSAYSSLCILNDGSIGLYVEESMNNDAYSMVFYKFSFDWLAKKRVYPQESR